VSFAECLGVFEEVPNKMAAGGLEQPDLTTVDACKQRCIDSVQHCAAVDLFEGKCFFHDRESFKHAKVENKIGAMHYLLKACISR